MNLIDFLAAKLKEQTNFFMITQNNSKYHILFSNLENYFEKVNIYLPNIAISIYAAENSKLNQKLLDNLYMITSYLISNPYISYYTYLVLYIIDNQIHWSERNKFDINITQNELINFFNDFTKRNLESYDQTLYIINDNYFIVYKNNYSTEQLVRQSSKYINTTNHVYKIDFLHEMYQIHDINNIMIEMVSKRTDMISKIFDTYNKAYKPYILPSEELEISIGTRYVKLSITNVEGLDDVLEYIDVDDLDKLSGAMERYFDILYKFNKLIIDNFDHIINKDLFTDIDIWLTDNVVSIYEDNNVDYWFNKMVVDLTL